MAGEDEDEVVEEEGEVDELEEDEDEVKYDLRNNADVTSVCDGGRLFTLDQVEPPLDPSGTELIWLRPAINSTPRGRWLAPGGGPSLPSGAERCTRDPLVPLVVGWVSNSGTGTLMPPAGRIKNLVRSLVGLRALDSFTRVTFPRRWPWGGWGGGGGLSGRSVKWSGTKFDPGPVHMSPSVHS